MAEINKIEVYTFSMTFARRTLAFALAGFFVFGILAYTGSMTGSMHAMPDGATHSVCPLMGGTSPACVNVLQHIAHWQSSFAAVLIELAPLVLLLAALCIGVRFLFIDRWRVEKFLFTNPLQLSYSQAILPRHYLQDAFSNGILNSKAY